MVTELIHLQAVCFTFLTSFQAVCFTINFNKALLQEPLSQYELPLLTQTQDKVTPGCLAFVTF